jgi:hypothetical protein
MNIRLKARWLGAPLALMGSMLAPAFADEWNKETKFEFSAPVEVPGKMLEAGKYVFRLADSDSDRNIVQIFSEDGSGVQKLVTTVFAISDYRTETPEKPIVQFEERRSGSPEAIHSWFYPGENTGWEFVYPQAERLALTSNTTLAAAPMPTPAPAAVPTPTPAPAPVLAPEPARLAALEPVESVTIPDDEVAIIAQEEALAPPSAQEADAQSSAGTALPHTAGQSGWKLVSGLAMLLAGIGAVVASRRGSVD